MADMRWRSLAWAVRRAGIGRGLSGSGTTEDNPPPHGFRSVLRPETLRCFRATHAVLPPEAAPVRLSVQRWESEAGFLHAVQAPFPQE